MIITSKSFDNGTACVAEQSVVLDEPIADRGTGRVPASAARCSSTPPSSSGWPS